MSLGHILWRLKILPNHQVHGYLDRLYFGKVYWKVHYQLDWPVRYTRGNHRAFFHDVTSVYAIARKEYPGDPNAVSSGLLHLQVDETCTLNPAYRKQLEFLSKRAVKERKKRKRAKKMQSTPKVFKEDLEFFEKILEIQKLHKAMCS